MSTTTKFETALSGTLDTSMLTRILDEGYGPGAWHGPDLKAAIGDVSPELAFWRPSAGRHNIAEIALHHAYYVHSVRGQLSATSPEPFVLEGEDWFEVPDASRLGWPQIQTTLDTEQRRLAESVRELHGRPSPPMAEALNLVLGITCHAVYHAGQIQLLKRLHIG